MKAPTVAPHGRRSADRAMSNYAAVSSTGVYYAVGNGNSLWSYSNGAWTELLSDTSGNGIQTVAVDPFNPNEIVVQTHGGSLNISYNGGATWSGDNWAAIKLNSTEFPGWPDTGHIYDRVGGTVFDPVGSERAMGFRRRRRLEHHESADAELYNRTRLLFGMTRASASNSWSPMKLSCRLAATRFSPPGIAHFSTISNPNAYPSTYGPVDGNICCGLVDRLCIVGSELSRRDCRLVGH